MDSHKHICHRNLLALNYAPFGRVTALRNAAGALVETSPGVPDLSALDTVFGHHGSVLDDDTGLALKGARWYSADIGRFVSEDPVQDGANWYAFAGNDPVNYADPTGLTPSFHPLAGGISGDRTYSSRIPTGGNVAPAYNTSFSFDLGGDFRALNGGARSASFSDPLRTTPASNRPSLPNSVAFASTPRTPYIAPLTSQDFVDANLARPVSVPGLNFSSAPQYVVRPPQIVSVEQVGGGWAGQNAANAAVRSERLALETRSAGAAFIHQLDAQIAKLDAFVLNTVFGYSEPGVKRTYDNGRSEIVLGGPSSGSLANQALLLVPAILPRTPAATARAPEVPNSVVDTGYFADAAGTGIIDTGFYPELTSNTGSRTSYWWSGRYSTAASQHGAFQASGGRVFPTNRNSGLAGGALRAEQEAFTLRALQSNQPIEVVRGQAAEAGLTVFGRNAPLGSGGTERLAQRGAENAIQRALKAYQFPQVP